jgi:hypothetical protein
VCAVIQKLKIQKKIDHKSFRFSGFCEGCKPVNVARKAEGSNGQSEPTHPHLEMKTGPVVAEGRLVASKG